MGTSPARSLGGLECALTTVERLQLFQDFLSVLQQVPVLGAENGTLSGSLGAELGLSLAGSLCQQDCGLQPGWIGAQL